VASDLSDSEIPYEIKPSDPAAGCSCKSPARNRTHDVPVEDDEEDEIFLQVNGVADGVRTHDNRNHNPRNKVLQSIIWYQ